MYMYPLVFRTLEFLEFEFLAWAGSWEGFRNHSSLPHLAPLSLVAISHGVLRIERYYPALGTAQPCRILT